MLAISKPVSRSTEAPEAIRPAVGTPRVTEEPDPPEAETAAQQALGVAHGGDVDVNARTRRGEGRQFGRDHDCGHILGVGVCAADIDPEPLGHAFQRLPGEGTVAQRIAGAVQTHDHAVADQLVAANAFNGGDVLDPRLGCGRGRADAQGQDGQGRDEAGEQILHGSDVSEVSSDTLCQDRAVI